MTPSHKSDSQAAAACHCCIHHQCDRLLYPVLPARFVFVWLRRFNFYYYFNVLILSSVSSHPFVYSTVIDESDFSVIDVQPGFLFIILTSYLFAKNNVWVNLG